MADPAGSFRTHANYVRAFSLLTGRRMFEQEGLAVARTAAAVRKSRFYENSRRSSASDPDRATASLRNAWGSELLLALGVRYVEQDEVVRLSNNWNVVMAYYASFHATHALLAAVGQPAPESHEKLQRQFCNYWVDRAMDIPPLTFGLTAKGFLNVPQGRTISDEHPWSACTESNCVGLAAKALRSTRRDKVDAMVADERVRLQRARQKARQQAVDARGESAGVAGNRVKAPQRVNLTKEQKAEIDNRVRSVSVLDYLYRLRLRSNYEDATMFTEGPEDSQVSSTFRRDLVYLTSTVVLCNELIIGRILGHAWLEDERARWCANNMPPGIALGVGLRLGQPAR